MQYETKRHRLTELRCKLSSKWIFLRFVPPSASRDEEEELRDSADEDEDEEEEGTADVGVGRGGVSVI